MAEATSQAPKTRKERSKSAVSRSAKPAKVQVRAAPKPAYDEQKFKELVLYLAEKSADDPSFGDTKLNKLLFFSDFLAYGIFGVPITGAAYQKLEFGPAPRRLLPARDELIDEGFASVVTRGRAYQRKVTINRRPANTHLFSTNELDLIDEVVDLLRNHDASDVSALSHRLSSGWQLANMREDIPYDSIFLAVGKELTSDEIARGQQVAAELGLTA
jgi:Protein of unknown function (DUF4065)